VPQTLRNPLYHWTHLEQKRYFGIDELLDESSASRVWDRANALLASSELRAHGILRSSASKPLHDRRPHRRPGLAQGHRGLEPGNQSLPRFPSGQGAQRAPPEMFNPWVARLEAASNTSIGKLTDLLDALRQRHDFFHQMGGRLSDHGLNHAYADSAPRRKRRRFSTRRAPDTRPRPSSSAGSPPT